MKIVTGKLQETSKSLKDLSFGDLYNEHWKLLYESAYAKTGSRQDAFDIVQDLFIHIWENRQNIGMPVSMKAFLLTSLRNKVFDHFRKNGVRQKVVQDFYRFAEVTVSNETEILEVEALKEDAEIAIRRAVDKLPEKMQYIVRQRWYHKKTIADISAELSVSNKTVKNNLSIALQRIRRHTEDNAVDIVFLLPLIFGLLESDLLIHAGVG